MTDHPGLSGGRFANLCEGCWWGLPMSSRSVGEPAATHCDAPDCDGAAVIRVWLEEEATPPVPTVGATDPRSTGARCPVRQGTDLGRSAMSPPSRGISRYMELRARQERQLGEWEQEMEEVGIAPTDKVRTLLRYARDELRGEDRDRTEAAVMGRSDA